MVFNNSTEIKWYRKKIFIWRIVSLALAISLLYIFFNNPSTNITLKPHIAHYNISGLLIDPDPILEDLEYLEHEDNIKAIIINVDSPGGTTVSAIALPSRTARRGPPRAVPTAAASSA